MSVSEMLELRAYFRVEPRGELREDARLALLRSAWVKAPLEDLLPRFRHRGEEESEEAIEHDKALLQGWAAAMRAQLAREDRDD